MPKVLALTGHTGFIGRDLVEVLELARVPYLVVGARDQNPIGESCVASISRRELEESTADGLAELLGCHDIGALVHLAWIGLPDYSPELCLWNFYFSSKIFLGARLAGIPRIVGVGSCFEYGGAIGELVEDTAPVEPSFFARTKSLLAESLSLVGGDGGPSTVWARPFWVYGPGQREGALIPSALGALGSNTGWQPKTPDSQIDFVHVRDVSVGLKLLAENLEVQGIVNLGSGTAARVGDVVSYLHAVWAGLEADPPRTFRDESSPRASLVRARDELGWEPTVSLEKGLTEILRLRRV